MCDPNSLTPSQPSTDPFPYHLVVEKSTSQLGVWPASHSGTALRVESLETRCQSRLTGLVQLSSNPIPPYLGRSADMTMLRSPSKRLWLPKGGERFGEQALDTAPGPKSSRPILVSYFRRSQCAVNILVSIHSNSHSLRSFFPESPYSQIHIDSPLPFSEHR